MAVDSDDVLEAMRNWIQERSVGEEILAGDDRDFAKLLTDFTRKYANERRQPVTQELIDAIEKAVIIVATTSRRARQH